MISVIVVNRSTLDKILMKQKTLEISRDPPPLPRNFDYYKCIKCSTALIIEDSTNKNQTNKFPSIYNNLFYSIS